ncbi:MAG TPA: ribonuclease P protein component [Clostridiaceae bacterium]|nr:ribonuclease P protein component [Clostridiaceae bacterium]
MNNTVPLKKNYEFQRIFKKGRFHAGRFMTLYALENRSGTNRLGITASRKVGKSVKRNRIKRLIRENYRLIEDKIESGYDIVFVARESSIMPEFDDIRKEMKYLLKRLNLLFQEK